MPSLAAARVPTAPLTAGLYESHYLTLSDPAGGRALWLRHTALKRPGQEAHPTVWLVWFDRSAGEPRALRVTSSQPIQDPGSDCARSDLGRFSLAGAEGEIEGASWSVAWERNAPELPYLPARWMYDRRIPRSGGVALIPAATASGSVTLPGDGPVELSGWNAMVGHNWGSEHAEHWTWVHAGGLGDDGRGWFDFVLVRVRVGPVLTPVLAAGAIHLDGETVATARRGKVRREIQGEATQLGLPLAGGVSIELMVDAPSSSTATWDYASPSGPGRLVRNCSVADGRVRLTGLGPERAFELPGRVAVEHGSPGH